jgi:hypothetical protein
MEYFVGLDVSMAETHVCVVTRNGAVIHNAKVRLPILRPSSRRFRPAVGSHSRRAGWLRCSITA